MHEGPDISEDDGALWDMVVRVGVGGNVCMWEAHGSDLMPAECFFYDSFDIWEVREIFGCGEAGGDAEDGVKFGLGRHLDAGEERHGEKKYAEG